jgi:hypothetical protein
MATLFNIGLHNKEVLAELLDENGFDSTYLLSWGLPDFWDDTYWELNEYVLKLAEYFEYNYKTYDTRDSLEEVEI